jgi:hypothetical protein
MRILVARAEEFLLLPAFSTSRKSEMPRCRTAACKLHDESSFCEPYRSKSSVKSN